MEKNDSQKKPLSEMEWEAKIDHTEMAALLDILENMEDQQMAVSWLKEFNRCNQAFGEVIKKGQSASPEELQKVYQDLRNIVTQILKQGNPLVAN